MSKVEDILQRNWKFVAPCYDRVYPLVVSRGNGVRIYDIDNKEYLDFTSGIATCNTGHCHPKIVSAIKEQAEKFLHMCFADFYYEKAIDLCQKLVQLSPGSKDRKAFLCNSGAEANEAAMKLARFSTRKNFFISFIGSFHGRTFGSLSITSNKSSNKKGYGSLLPTVFVPYPYCYRCFFKLEYPSCGMQCLSFIREILEKAVPAEEVAAVFIEPILGEGGYVVPPDDYVTKLYSLCKENDILFVADEVQTGFGRTGKMFACEHFHVDPDIFTLAKGIASGLPLGAMVAKDSLVTDWSAGSHGSTFGGNPVSCAAALATIEVVQELLENVERVGNYLIAKLKQLAEKFEVIGDVRGKGLMVAIEIVRDRTRKEPARAERSLIIKKCFQNGLLALPCGQSSIRFCPPLILKEQEVDEAIEKLESSLSACY